jgi:hypothetical protein
MPSDRRILPAPRRRRGRNERALDEVARLLAREGVYDEIARALATLGRTTGAGLDRLEDDPGHSEHVLGSVARVHREVLGDLRSFVGEGDDLAALFASFDEPADDRHPPVT